MVLLLVRRKRVLLLLLLLLGRLRKPVLRLRVQVARGSRTPAAAGEQMLLVVLVLPVGVRRRLRWRCGGTSGSRGVATDR